MPLNPSDIVDSTWKGGEPITPEALRVLAAKGPWQLTNERLAAAAALEQSRWAPRSPSARRVCVEYRTPQSAEVRSIPLELHGDGKVRLVVVRGTSAIKAAEACYKAGVYEGATVLPLPPGAEFEVWEEP